MCVCVWGGGGGYTCNIYISYVGNLCFVGSLLIMIRQNSGPNEFGNKQNSTLMMPTVLSFSVVIVRAMG